MRKDTLGFNPTAAESSTSGAKTSGSGHDPRQAALFLDDAKLVGIDETRKKLNSLLLEEDDRRTIIAVVGTGGLGTWETKRVIPKWLTHYCSYHQILLVGDGDFSFSLSLAKAFGSASNIVASSLDTYGKVIKKYKHAKSNLDELQKMGACLLHGMDATKMKFYPDLKIRRFDRVIFNFPHAGFHGKEDNLSLIKMHRDLVFGFFKNASHMLRANGEIHVNHKTTPPFDYWNIEKLAMQSFLILIDCVDFKKEDYPGYNNKRGDGNRCDEPFPLGECSTFKFIYNPRFQKNHLRRNHMEISRQETNRLFREIQNLEQLPAPVDLNYYPQTSLFPKMNELVRPVFDMRNGYTPISRRDYFNNVTEEIHGRVAFSADLRNEFTPISRDYCNNVTETHGRFACPADLRNGYTPISRDYINNVTEVHGRVTCSADCYYCARDSTLDSRRLLQPMESLQSLQPWPTSTNCRYSLTDPLRRTMDIAPSISLGARNEGYPHQVFGGGSRYLQEEFYRTAQRPSYCFEFDRARPDYFEKYNADVPRRTWNSEIYVAQ